MRAFEARAEGSSPSRCTKPLIINGLADGQLLGSIPNLDKVSRRFDSFRSFKSVQAEVVFEYERNIVK